MEEENLNEHGVDIDWWERIGKEPQGLFRHVKDSLLAAGAENICAAPGTPPLTKDQFECIAHNAAFNAACALVEMNCNLDNGMRSYLGAKIIDAKQMTYGTYVLAGNSSVNKEIEAEADGYMVVYPDGYTSWSPKAVFEEAYRPVNDAEKGMVASGKV